MDRLPLRPVPFDGEHLYSLVARAARANHVSNTRFGLVREEVSRRSTSRLVLETAATALDLSEEEMIAMTLDVYPVEVVGRGHKALSRTWRVPHVRWFCPRCTARTGVYLRDWQLALHPVCITCPSLLIREDAPADMHEETPDRRAVAAQRQVAILLGDVRADPSRASDLRLLYDLVVLVSLTQDEHWPLLKGWEAELRSARPRGFDDWTAGAPRSPAAAALIVLECARALACQYKFRRLVHEALDRLQAGLCSRPINRSTNLMSVLSPDVRVTTATELVPGPDADAEHARLVRDLGALASTCGLTSRHVPGWALWRGEGFGPPLDVAPQRAEVALAAHMLVSGPSPDPDAERRARIAFDATGTWTITRQLASGQGINAEHADTIRAFAHTLVDDGLVDYAERRRVLANAPALTRSLGRQLTAWGHAVADTEHVAAWAWIALTQGPPWHTSLTEHAYRIDVSLDPEQRMTLQAMALDYVGEARAAGRVLRAPTARDTRGVA